MIRFLYIYESPFVDPHLNLAIEEHLLKITDEQTCILYLWQNQNTVVIGRNQNAWAECRTELLHTEGGKLARRLSGGGAVFHDIGNLNFTFLMAEENYDLKRQLNVLRTACAACGIHTDFTGRNDLTVNGSKFSGNAFYHSNGKAYHHGTILIDANMDKLARYLSPSKAKLEAKGVASVRSRVTNLNVYSPELTCSTMKEKMRQAFSSEYGLPYKVLTLSPETDAQIQASKQKYGSHAWLYGTPLPFSFSCEDRFEWGSIQLNLQINKGVIVDTIVYTDAMQWDLPDTLKKCLNNCAFHTDEIKKALLACSELSGTVCEDIYHLIQKQNI